MVVGTEVRGRSRVIAARGSAALGVLAWTLTSPAAAQEGQDTGSDIASAEAATGKDEIVVTGTLVRGVAPTGTNVIGVSREKIQETGATTTAQLLQSIPQIGAFGSLQTPTFAGNNGTVNRPNLRNFPGANVAGGTTTLVLLDGRRMVGMGVLSTSPDPDVIPPGAIERVEILADGGSAIYGSDAVAGILNFITRKRFDGLKVEGHYGFAADYYQYDASATAGRDWGSGSLYVAYNYSKHSELIGLDRDYVRTFPDAATGRLSIQCDPGNVQVGTTMYRLPFTTATAVPNTFNQCDSSDYQSALYPREQRHSVMAGFYQELNDGLTLDIKGFYTNRKTTRSIGPFRATRTVTGASPFFLSHRIGNEASQSVSFAIGPNDANHQDLNLEAWGISSNLTARLGGNWQLRVLGNFGESETLSRSYDGNTAAMDAAIAAGYINPYAASDPSPVNYADALAAIGNFETYGRARQSMTNARALVDGDLLHLPGGPVKLAAGAEFFREHYKVRLGSAVPSYETVGYSGLTIGGRQIIAPFAALPLRDLSRNVKSVFGELVVPVFGAENATGGLQELSLSAAGRYDHYSDFGGTFNPKLGVSWRPTSWLKLRGSYGKSFNAPSLADSAGADVRRVLTNSGLPTGTLLVTNGGKYPVPTAAQTTLLILRGNSDAIAPQRASTLSLGFDLTPRFDEGLKLSMTFYQAKVTGLIAVPPFQLGTSVVLRDYGVIATVNPTPAQVAGALAFADVGQFTNGGTCPNNNFTTCTYAILDGRKQNLGNFNLQALDLNVDWRRDTGFGAIVFGFNGTYELKRQESAAKGLPLVNKLAFNGSRYKFRTSLGAEIGDLFAQATLSHQAGYKLDPVVGFIPQSRVDSFTVVDLFFRYDVEGEGLLKDLQFTANVNNLFNRTPPEYRGTLSAGSTQGVQNGSTIGRFVQVGVSKSF